MDIEYISSSFEILLFQFKGEKNKRGNEAIFLIHLRGKKQPHYQCFEGSYQRKCNR